MSNVAKEGPLKYGYVVDSMVFLSSTSPVSY